MQDLLQPWVIKSALVISALALIDVFLYMVCVRVERRNRVHGLKSSPSVPNVQS
jgi:hypothetical protein